MEYAESYFLNNLQKQMLPPITNKTGKIVMNKMTLGQ